MHIKTTWQGDKVFESTSADNFTVIIDDEADGRKHKTSDLESGNSLGTTGTTIQKRGQSPAELLVSALGGCMGISIMTSLQNYKEGVETLSIDLDAKKGPKVPKAIDEIELTINIKTDIKPKIVERVVALSHEKYCTISNSINAKTTYTINFID